MEAMRNLEGQRPWVQRIKQKFGKLENEFDFGEKGEKSRVFVRKYIPVLIKKVVKPELILWQNLDFVNQKLT